MRAPSGILPVLWLAGMGGPAASLAAQSADSSVSSIVSELPAASRIRVIAAGKRLSGHLVQLGQDSLTLRTPETIQTLSLQAIDTLWVAGRRGHRGLLSGLAFGAVMFGLLQLEGSSEDPGLNTRMGLVLLGGATAVGLLLDGASGNWARRFPPSGQ
ncbi:MAG TPA: hypothetical protein VHH32_01000 [Gemmatimonadales bacterium]|nr:hypothetical protein [Gemmatimonadales bacterium]